MRGRAFHVALLVFEALWLNVIVPGHRRGVVPLPGESCAACERPLASAAPTCCQSDAARKQHSRSKHDHGDPALHCAICYFAARLSPAPFVDFTLPPLRLTRTLPTPAAELRTTAPPTLTYDGRAPPPVA